MSRELTSVTSTHTSGPSRLRFPSVSVVSVWSCLLSRVFADLVKELGRCWGSHSA